MSEILNIINRNLDPYIFDNNNFTGKVYFQNEDGLHINRSVHYNLINKYNFAFDEDILTIEDELLLVFINEIFVDNSNSWFEKDKKIYLSAIITDYALYSIYSEETDSSKEPNIFCQPWYTIDSVELHEDSDGEYIFRFYEKGVTNYIDLLSNRFGTSSPVASRKLLDIFSEVIEYRKQTIAHSDNEFSELKLEITQLSNNGQFLEAVEKLETFGNLYNVDDVTLQCSQFYHWWKTQSLFYLKELDKALATIEDYINKCENLGEYWAYSYMLKGKIFLEKNQYSLATNTLAFSEEKFQLEDEKKISRGLKEESYSNLKELFLEIPNNQRKLIFIGEEIYATQSNAIIVLKKNDLPFNLNFPVGHPHVNEVYTCHPHKQDFYLPIKSHSEELFLDRIHEFSWLLQCLGASTLEISSSTIESSDQAGRSKTEVDADLDYKLSGGKLNYQRENTRNSVLEGKLNIAKKQVFKPTKSPFVPDGLVWYHSNTSWQRLAHQRLNGSIMIHNELISSSQSETLSTQELMQVDAELKILLPKLGVKYNSEEEVNTSSLKKYEWMVNVEFADVHDLSQMEQSTKLEQVGNLNTDNEKYNLNIEKYKEDVIFMLEDDGIIDENERSILNRKMKKYGLTEDDVRLIENELTMSDYSENEIKYIEELKELLEDGEINDLERKILDRYAKKFNLTVDVQKKIDAVFIN